MTALNVQAIPPRMARTKHWHENVNLTLWLGAKAEMDALLRQGEDRTDLIRAGIKREIAHRLKEAARAKSKPSD